MEAESKSCLVASTGEANDLVLAGIDCLAQEVHLNRLVTSGNTATKNLGHVNGNCVLHFIFHLLSLFV